MAQDVPTVVPQWVAHQTTSVQPPINDLALIQQLQALQLQQNMIIAQLQKSGAAGWTRGAGDTTNQGGTSRPPHIPGPDTVQRLNPKTGQYEGRYGRSSPDVQISGAGRQTKEGGRSETDGSYGGPF